MDDSTFPVEFARGGEAMAEGKNQHYVPQCHMRFFSIGGNSDFVRVHLLGPDREVPVAPISGQCSKSYFYGRDLKIEKFLNSPEGHFASHVRMLTNNPSAPMSEIKLLLLHWVIQQIRSRHCLTNMLAMMNALRKLASAGLSSEEEIIEHLGPPATIDRAMTMAMRSVPDFCNILGDLTLCIVNNKTRVPFIMSDNPAIMANRFLDMKYPGSPRAGMSSPGLYLAYPLTPTLAFLAYDKFIYSVTKVDNLVVLKSDQHARSMNFVLAQHADAVVILPPGEHDISYYLPDGVKANRGGAKSTNSIASLIDTDEAQGVEVFQQLAEGAQIPTDTDLLGHFQGPSLVCTHHPSLLRFKQYRKSALSSSGRHLVRPDLAG